MDKAAVAIGAQRGEALQRRRPHVATRMLREHRDEHAVERARVAPRRAHERGEEK